MNPEVEYIGWRGYPPTPYFRINWEGHMDGAILEEHEVIKLGLTVPSYPLVDREPYTPA